MNNCDYIKTVNGKHLLYVMATQAEYGPKLRGLYTPLITGVGPVESAIKLTQFLGSLHQLPDLVISVGSAGSSKLEIMSIYQVSSVSYRDMDARPLGFEKGVTPFLGLPSHLKMPCLIPNLPCASLSCGGNIVSGHDYDTIDTDMVEMETFSCLRACQVFGLPLIGLRGISDGNSEIKELGDWTKHLDVLDERLAEQITILEDLIAKNIITEFK